MNSTSSSLSSLPLWGKKEDIPSKTIRPRDLSTFLGGEIYGFLHESDESRIHLRTFSLSLHEAGHTSIALLLAAEKDRRLQLWLAVKRPQGTYIVDGGSDGHLLQ
jgi:hypothetical protein